MFVTRLGLFGGVDDHSDAQVSAQPETRVSNRYIDVTLSLGASSTTITPGHSGRAMSYPQDPYPPRSLPSAQLATHIQRDMPCLFRSSRRSTRRSSRLCI